MKGFPVGILAVLKWVTLSGSNISKEGSNRPSMPVFAIDGVVDGVNRIQPMPRKTAVIVAPVNHLTCRVDCWLRNMAIASALRMTQAMLNRICCFGDKSSLTPPQLQEIWLSMRKMVST